MKGICSFRHRIRPSRRERCAAILHAQSSESIGRSTTDHQASFGAPILACIRGLSGQQTKVLGRERILEAELNFVKS
jgi:hypothetical protein